jgi:hypothetical protein
VTAKAVRRAGLDPRARIAVPRQGHELPVGATTPFGWPRADFAIAPAAPADGVHGAQPPGRRTMLETAPAAGQPAMRLGLSMSPALAGLGGMHGSVIDRLLAAGRSAGRGLSSALVPGAAAQSLSCTPPADDPEIVSLARALGYSLPLIYEYVYYNVDFTPTWGSKKSALGTYLDRRGNQIDQNNLFVALLRQSYIRANFRHGLIGGDRSGCEVFLS